MGLSRVVKTVSKTAGSRVNSESLLNRIVIPREDRVVLFVDSYPYSVHGSIPL